MSARNLFKHRPFSKDIIWMAMRWYCRNPLSYRDVRDLLGVRREEGHLRPLEALGASPEVRGVHDGLHVPGDAVVVLVPDQQRLVVLVQRRREQQPLEGDPRVSGGEKCSILPFTGC
jgi:hypothetical protein